MAICLLNVVAQGPHSRLSSSVEIQAQPKYGHVTICLYPTSARVLPKAWPEYIKLKARCQDNNKPFGPAFP